MIFLPVFEKVEPRTYRLAFERWISDRSGPVSFGNRVR